jgi:NADPH:quinone reductase-like Zn-dependent oxidoreductase
MRAVALHHFESGVDLSELPAPEAAGDELLVRVHASSVNGIDVFTAAGMLKGMMEHEFPVTLGRDFAGTVEQIGTGVSRFQVGDEVLGFLPTGATLHVGTWADYVAVPEDAPVARKPATLDFIQAGALPLAALTALAAVDAVRPQQGHTVLIVGAGGGVGGYAVQLAAGRGATVVATGREDDADRLRRLGASDTIDFATEDVGAAIRERHPDGLDALIDVVNRGDGLATLAELVRDGGRVASALGAADTDALARRGIAATNVMAAADPDALAQLAELAADGRLEIPIQHTYPLKQANEAIQAFGAGKRGKLALSLV